MTTSCEKQVLEYLLRFDYLNEGTESIVNRVLKNDPLTPDQADIFLREIVTKYFQMKCKACGSAIAIGDVPFVVESEGMCHQCDAMARRLLDFFNDV
jgi:hypothetical protein